MTSTCLTLPSPALPTFARLDELGLEDVGQRLEPGRAALACRVVEPDQWCRRCGCEGTVRDTVVRRLAHEHMGWRPTTLEVKVRRYRCAGCGHLWRQDTSTAAEPQALLSHRGLRWALEAIARGRALMQRLIASLRHGVPAALSEAITRGRTLAKRAADVLAYFDRAGTSNGPTEAIYGRLEHLRGKTLGFRNLTNYIARSLLETGGFRPRLHLGF